MYYIPVQKYETEVIVFKTEIVMTKQGFID